MKPQFFHPFHKDQFLNSAAVLATFCASCLGAEDLGHSTMRSPLIEAAHKLKPIRLPEGSGADAGAGGGVETLARHLTLFDLLCIGIGGTLGTGVFALCGVIANEYAG